MSGICGVAVQKRISDPEALLDEMRKGFPSYLRWQTVEPLLSQHFSGQADWTPLVAVLATFEVAHRLWVA